MFGKRGIGRALLVGLALAGLAQSQDAAIETFPATARFFDGSTMPLTIRSRVDGLDVNVNLPAAQNLERLEPLAHQGDARAQYAIYYVLRDCSQAARTEAQLAAWLADLKQGRVHYGPTRPAEPLSQGDTAERREKSYRLYFERCRGVSDAQFAQMKDWLFRTAESGYHLALIDATQFNELLVHQEQLPDEALIKWNQARWNHGDMEGLDRLSRLYEKQSTLLSVAHEVLYVALLEALTGLPRETGARFRLEHMKRRLQFRINDLVPQERVRVVQDAKALLKSNPRCCAVHLPPALSSAPRASAPVVPAVQPTPTSIFPIVAKFSDGASIPIKLRQRPDFWHADPTVSARANIERLKPLAEAGDVAAQYGLFHFINPCGFHARTQAQLDRWIGDLRDRKVHVFGEDTRPLGAGETAESYEARYRAGFKGCGGITDADIAAGRRWLRQSAEGGFYWGLIQASQLDVNNHLKEPVSPAELQKWTRARWDHGEMGVLDNLARQHEASDPVRSVAYLLVGSALLDASQHLPQSPSAKRALKHMQESLAPREAKLSAEDRKRALGLAKEILRSNKSCCYLH
jgi:hypothetical protein